jgi:hypothetical protein
MYAVTALKKMDGTRGNRGGADDAVCAPPSL